MHVIFVLELLHEFEMIHKRVMSYGYLSGEVCVVNHRSLSVEWKSLLGLAVTYSIEAPHEVQVPGRTAKFTIGYCMKPCRLFLYDEVGYALVLDRL